MKVLAFDTSTELCSCALLSGDEIEYREKQAGQSHSEVLLPMIDSLLTDAGLRLASLDAIAFGCGPGSFTGLRIACGVAQGLALGANLPVVAITSLLALAEGQKARRVVACVDARMREIYHAAYEREEDEWKCVSPPALCCPDDAPLLAGHGWSGCGSGFKAHGDVLSRRYAGKLAAIDSEALPRAGEIVRLAARRFARGEVTDAADAAPLYLRDKVALKAGER
ncbi:MAG: tRNA (adenosine(37)-N6)-threonylcarbamoyltransferase complex dimerization subunit type 1 TsaB [Burkholderiales bacterium]